MSKGSTVTFLRLSVLPGAPQGLGDAHLHRREQYSSLCPLHQMRILSRNTLTHTPRNNVRSSLSVLSPVALTHNMTQHGWGPPERPSSACRSAPLDSGEREG